MIADEDTDCSSHFVAPGAREGLSRMTGNETKFWTRAADHGFGEQPQPDTNLTGQETVALSEARAAERPQLA
jgi:hypothetical protein